MLRLKGFIPTVTPAPNVVIAKNVTIADGCFISAMSLVNKGGTCFALLKTTRPWTEEQPYKDEFERCEKLKRKMNLNI